MPLPRSQNGCAGSSSYPRITTRANDQNSTVISVSAFFTSLASLASAIGAGHVFDADDNPLRLKRAV
jgi:hypothetical protein